MAAIRGLRQAINQLRQLRQQSNEAIRGVMEEIGQTVEQEAKNAAPKETSALVNSIGHEVGEKGLSVQIFAAVPYAPYIEFGTGPFVEVPTGYEDYARTFFVSGKGVGRPHPFLFPAGLRANATLEQKLRTALDKLDG